MKVKLLQKGYSACKTVYQRGKEVVRIVQDVKKEAKPEVLAKKREEAQRFLQSISEEKWKKCLTKSLSNLVKQNQNIKHIYVR